MQSYERITYIVTIILIIVSATAIFTYQNREVCITLESGQTVMTNRQFDGAGSLIYRGSECLPGFGEFPEEKESEFGKLVADCVERNNAILARGETLTKDHACG